MINILTVALAAGQQSGGGQQGPMGNITFFALMAGTIAIFYFLLIRPQKKKEKERVDMISTLKKGDRVLTAGGMYGTVDSFKEGDIVVLKISGNTKADFLKSAIQNKVT